MQVAFITRLMDYVLDLINKPLSTPPPPPNNNGRKRNCSDPDRKQETGSGMWNRRHSRLWNLGMNFSSDKNVGYKTWANGGFNLQVKGTVQPKIRRGQTIHQSFWAVIALIWFAKFSILIFLIAWIVSLLTKEVEYYLKVVCKFFSACFLIYQFS